jgi:hypothetical protein
LTPRDREAAVGFVMIKCPATGRDIPTGIEMDRSSFARAAVFFSRTYCPICRTSHEWYAQEAWVREARSDRSTVGAQRS